MRRSILKFDKVLYNIMNGYYIMNNKKTIEKGVYTVGKTTFEVEVDFGESKDGQIENLIRFLIDYIEKRDEKRNDK